MGRVPKLPKSKCKVWVSSKFSLEWFFLLMNCSRRNVYRNEKVHDLIWCAVSCALRQVLLVLRKCGKSVPPLLLLLSHVGNRKLSPNENETQCEFQIWPQMNAWLPGYLNHDNNHDHEVQWRNIVRWGFFFLFASNVPTLIRTLRSVEHNVINNNSSTRGWSWLVCIVSPYLTSYLRDVYIC